MSAPAAAGTSDPSGASGRSGRSGPPGTPGTPGTSEPVGPRRRRRTLGWLGPVVVLVVLGVAVHVLLPQVAEVRRTFHSLADARWWYVAPAVAASALTFVGATWSIQGATTHVLPFWRTTQAMVGSAFLGRIAPANLGSLGVTGAYLHAAGVSLPAATAALGVDALAGVVVHVVLLVVAAALVGRFPHPHLALPSHFGLVVGVAGGLALVGITAALLVHRHDTRWTSVLRRFTSAVREGRVELVRVVRDPRRGVRLLGGSLLITVAQIACLGLSVAAFGDHTDVVTLAFVYLAGAAVSAVAPTPGGLGAMETALVSGLTLFGVAAGPAVAGVLLYRLLTFWLPIAPGAVAVRDLHRRALL